MTKEQIINFKDIPVEENGKTIEECNKEKTHNIPINTLVECTYNEWYGKGACERVHARLFVIEHTRDYDSTPLYPLGRYQYKPIEEHDSMCKHINNIHPSLFKHWYYRGVTGMREEDLTPIELTNEIIDGVGALESDEIVKTTNDDYYKDVLNTLNAKHGTNFPTNVLTRDIVALINYMRNIGYNDGVMSKHNTNSGLSIED